MILRPSDLLAFGVPLGLLGASLVLSDALLALAALPWLGVSMALEMTRPAQRR